jgi:quercetin dioxygenase-like cupin family protein
MNTTLQPYVNTRQDQAFRFLGVPTMIRSATETTNGAYGLIESWSMPPGFGSPYHVHHQEDEAFYVVEGEMAFVCDGKWIKGGPGTYVFGPREIPHGFKVIGTGPARMLLLCSPGGFERFVLEQAQDLASPPAPPDMAKMVALAAKYKIDILGDLPAEDGGLKPTVG